MNTHKLKFKYHLPRPLRSNKGYSFINPKDTVEESIWFLVCKNSQFHHMWVDEKFLDENIRNRDLGYVLYSGQHCTNLRKFKKVLRKNPNFIGKLVLQSNQYLDDYEFDIESII